MAKILPFFISLMFLIVLGMAPALAAASLHGTVYDSIGNPLGGVKVTATSEQPYIGRYQAYSDTTDSKGEYRLQYMWFGQGEMDYVVEFMRQGYGLVGGDFASATVRDGETAVLDAVMNASAGSSIYGHVYGADGAPIGGAHVEIRSNMTQTNASVGTDADGYYKAEGLQMGEYSVSITYGKFSFFRRVELGAEEAYELGAVLSGAPDLEIQGLGISEKEPELGEDVEIDFRIRNRGEGDAGPFRVEVYDNGEIIGTLIEDGMEAGTSVDREIEYAFFTGGKHTIRVVADSDDDVDEEDEGNNEGEIEVEVSYGGKGTYLKAFCDIDTDTRGFSELKVKAGYRDETGFYCYKTYVNATIGGKTYQMSRQYNCIYSHIIQLPKGWHSFHFEALYPDGSTRDTRCSGYMGGANASKLSIIIEYPANASVAAATGRINLAAYAKLGDTIQREGNMTAVLKEKGKSKVLAEVMLQRDSYGQFTGTLALPDKESQYMLTFRYENGPWDGSSYVYFNTSYTASDTPSEGGTKVVVFAPHKEQYDVGMNMSVSAKVTDLSGFLVTDANVTLDIYRNNNQILKGKAMEFTRYSYDLQHNFTKAGKYRLVVTAVDREGTKAIGEREVQIGMGGEDPIIIQDGPLRVSIITPRSDTYPENSSLNVLARVTYEGDPVNDAEVTASFAGKRIKMNYVRFGEYSCVIPPSESGQHDLYVDATYGEDKARAKVIFRVSKNFLSLTILNPENRSNYTMQDGDSLIIRMDVLDIRKDVAIGAQVIVKVTEPTGRVHEMQSFQDPNTGEYVTVFYPNDNGRYVITAEASKPGYVADITETEFVVLFQEETWLAGMTWNTLLTVILLVGIIMLLAAILKGAFF